VLKPDLREVVAKWLLVLEDSEWEWDKESEGVRNMCLLNADSLLSQHGVVQLDENQELPWNHYQETIDLDGEGMLPQVRYAFAEGQLSMGDFKRVRPLR